MVFYYCTNFSAQEVKIEELKKINDRFRRQGESQKDEMDILKSQVSTHSHQSVIDVQIHGTLLI